MNLIERIERLEKALGLASEKCGGLYVTEISEAFKDAAKKDDELRTAMTRGPVLILESGVTLQPTACVKLKTQGLYRYYFKTVGVYVANRGQVNVRGWCISNILDMSREQAEIIAGDIKSQWMNGIGTSEINVNGKGKATKVWQTGYDAVYEAKKRRGIV
jgi:hypothetical protein